MDRSTNSRVRVFLILLVCSTVMFCAGERLSAAAYPERPISIVCGWGSGSMMDNLIRVLSRAAEKELGQPIVNENKPGASGVIAKAYVCKSKPDGYTLGTTVTATYIIQPQIGKTPYDPFKDVVDIMTFSEYNDGVAVKADAPWNSIEDVVAYAKANPGKFTYAHPGVGMMPHIVMEHFAMKEGIKWQGVPFKSGSEVNNAVLGGHTMAGVAGSSDLIPQVQAGKMKVLVIISGNRWSALPKVPTIVEKGHDFYVLSYVGIYGPKGLPEPIRAKLEQVFKNAMNDRAFQDMMKQYTIEPAYLSGKDYSAKWKALYAPMGKILNTLGLVEK
jgi:tripartite-type tricarboxylate transporter receptor subunit TctC